MDNTVRKFFAIGWTNENILRIGKVVDFLMQQRLTSAISILC